MVDHAERIAAEAGRESLYLAGTVSRRNGQTKEDLARQIAERDGVTEGLVCVLRTVEPCRTFSVRRQEGRLEIFNKVGKCLQFYFYLIDPEFGFMHVRVQSWLPYEIQVYLNGRERLARQLDAAGVGYLRHHNALLRIDDLERAGALCERFAHRSWPRVLDAFARRVNPHLPALLTTGASAGYYWVTDQAEIATDVMFETARRCWGHARPDLPRRPAPVLPGRAGVLGPQAPPLPGRRGGHRRQKNRRVAGQAPGGSELDQGL